LAAEPAYSSGMRRASAVRSRQSLRRFGLILGAGAAVITLHGVFGNTPHAVLRNTDSSPLPSKATPAAAPTGLSLRQRVVAIAESQVGYSADPSNSYCNKFSAYWNSGMADCPSGELDEEWCADFAAWVWQQAGVHITYGYGPGEINAGAVSFYHWGIANGEWHPATSGYVAAPGDVAVYGLSLGPDVDPLAQHVAIVTADAPGQRGPDVVDGDGDRTAFSIVEFGTDQVTAYAGHRYYTLSGYVSLP
jgi:CHAP domain